MPNKKSKDPVKPHSIGIPESLWEEVSKNAEDNDLSVSAYITQIIKEKLKKC